MLIDQDEIHKLSISDDVRNRLKSINHFSDNFESLPDKLSAWSDLVKLIGDEDFLVRKSVIHVLVCSFSSLSSKNKSFAWFDIHKLAIHEDPYVRMYVSYVLVSVFPVVPAEHKFDVLTVLSRLTRDKKELVRQNTAEVISSLFSSIPPEYKFSAWNKLIRLAVDDDSIVRFNAVSSIGSAFCLIPEKYKLTALNNLRYLALDKSSSVRMDAIYSLSYAFSSIPENYKSTVWSDIIKLTSDKQLVIRQIAADSLSSVFSFIPDEYKSSAWDDLIKLINNNSDVRDRISNTLLCAVSAIPAEYKSVAIDDLSGLRNDKNLYVKMNANYCLGKICIYKASESDTEIDSKVQLGEAIQYFEKASKGSNKSCSVRFCHLFYRSFDAVLFNAPSSGNKIKTYIAAAKNEVGNSIHKKKLLDIVEQLAEVLETIEQANQIDIEYQELLKRCSSICDHVDQLMDETKDKTPFIYGIYKKARPSFRTTIKEIIEDIKEKAEAACRGAKGTVDSEAACELYKESQRLNEAADAETNLNTVESIAFIVKNKIRKNPEYHYLLLDVAKLDSEVDLNKKLSIIRDILGVVEFGSSSIETNEKLDAIYDVAKANASSINQTQKAVDILMESVDELQNPQEYLDTIRQNLEEIKYEIPGMKKKIDEVLYELYSPAGVNQKLKVAIPIIPMLVSYELEANVPKIVADRISDLKKLVMRGRK